MARRTYIRSVTLKWKFVQYIHSNFFYSHTYHTLILNLRLTLDACDYIFLVKLEKTSVF